MSGEGESCWRSTGNFGEKCELEAASAGESMDKLEVTRKEEAAKVAVAETVGEDDKTRE